MGRKSVIYKCELCSYSTNRKTNFINHKNRKISCKKLEKEDITECEFCNKQFTCKKSIYNHLKICKIKIGISKYNSKLIKENNELKKKIIKEQLEKNN